MWYCSLCDRSLGEISSDSDHNNQPTCPYCHCAVEEESKPMDSVVIVDNLEIKGSIKPFEKKEISTGVGPGGNPFEFSRKAAEPLVEYLFEIIAKSLDESNYSEYTEDIIHIVRSAFKPKAEIAYGEIAKRIMDGFMGEDGGLVDLEESFEDDGVLLAKALTDVATAIADLNERVTKIENTVTSIEKQVMLPNPRMRKKETQWQEM